MSAQVHHDNSLTILNSIVALLVTLHHSPSLLVKLTVCVVFIGITVLQWDREATVVVMLGLLRIEKEK